jgi:hypothetical protein
MNEGNSHPVRMKVNDLLRNSPPGTPPPGRSDFDLRRTGKQSTLGLKNFGIHYKNEPA